MKLDAFCGCNIFRKSHRSDFFNYFQGLKFPWKTELGVKKIPPGDPIRVNDDVIQDECDANDNGNQDYNDNDNSLAFKVSK